MPTVAYFANSFPSEVEPYVVDEILELQKRGIVVIPGSARQPHGFPTPHGQALSSRTLYLQPLQLRVLLQAVLLGLRKLPVLKDFLRCVLLKGRESPTRRLRALMHTWLGLYYAVLLMEKDVCHIHVHHGYFGSWIAMVAARMLGVGFSMTLHGSDLLVNRAYLDVKLRACNFCVTVSDFNRSRLLEDYPQIDPDKIVVHRMGVDCGSFCALSNADEFRILAVGRLHPVKDHAFLLRACQALKTRGFRFSCLLAGEGESRAELEKIIHDLSLESEISLPGHLSRTQLHEQYRIASVVVLTSRSEGLPLALMEAMAHGRPVLAPDITGIPELVIPGKTGFLYRQGSLQDFVEKVEFIAAARSALEPVCRAAGAHVREHFDRAKNLRAFADFFVSQLAYAPGADLNRHSRASAHENPVLQ